MISKYKIHKQQKMVWLNKTMLTIKSESENNLFREIVIFYFDTKKQFASGNRNLTFKNVLSFLSDFS